MRKYLKQQKAAYVKFLEGAGYRVHDASITGHQTHMLSANIGSVRAILSDAAFVEALGLNLLGAGKGWCETELQCQQRYEQQDGYVHAGVQATVADHTAGAAAITVLDDNRRVLTAEFKINFLRPALVTRLLCRAEVLKAGSSLVVVESCVFNEVERESKLVAKALVTLAIRVGKGNREDI
ncbi:MAG: PaaI family thioesterase [Dehalococcoidia bacterium]